jgi:hypothetical protein
LPRELDNSTFYTERLALEGLQRWLSNPSSDLLHIQWPVAQARQSASTGAAERLVRILREDNIPTVSYFFAGTQSISEEAESEATSGTLGMLYALIWQLSNYLPRVMADDPPYITMQDFTVLDGTPESSSAALNLLKILLAQLRQPITFCVVDGLQWANIAGASTHIEDTLVALVELLAAHVTNSAKLGRCFKLLFTSSGVSEILGDALEADNVIWVDQSPKGKGPGKRGIGKQSLTNLSFV